MAQLVHFWRETGRPVEYIVIDEDDLTDNQLIEEYGESGFKLGDKLDIIGDVTSLPTGRSLTSSW